VPLSGGDLGGVEGDSAFDVNARDGHAGTYLEATTGVGVVSMTTGARVDRFGQAHATTVDPRLNVRIALGRSRAIRYATGIYHQAGTVILRQRASAGCSGVEIVCECTDTTTLAAALVDVPADAALVDVRMPGDDLFEVLANVAQRHSLPALVFATANDRYAVCAFDLNAVDHLVKPFTASRFENTIARLRGRGTVTAHGVPRLLRDLERQPDRLLVPDGQRMVPLALTSIQWIRAEGDYARIHADGRRISCTARSNDLEMRLDAAQFLRIHRFAIVRLDQIVEVQPAGSSRYRVTLLDGTSLIVSRGRAASLKGPIL
jgi:two-component system LytT family response regulator